MATPKQYFHDRTILLLLSINAFVGFGSALIIAVRLLTNHTATNSYIVQFRSSLGLDAFTTGSIYDLLSFVAFLLFVTVGSYALSHRAYPLRRHLAIIVLSLSFVLVVLAAIVGNALLDLR